ncbi:early transcription factor 82 kDa subunit [Equine parapoxvirus]|nr:early transcription factor 82 kDa subunit [Equine parapoxvirus]WOC35517.1 early transcription factor 82 kDa subunit [Equine parapoxvirus]WOC35534.1 early transcription factor 82 kDa subunit [Equine parapoxvirus]
MNSWMARICAQKRKRLLVSRYSSGKYISTAVSVSRRPRPASVAMSTYGATSTLFFFITFSVRTASRERKSAWTSLVVRKSRRWRKKPSESLRSSSLLRCGYMRLLRAKKTVFSRAPARVASTLTSPSVMSASTARSGTG